jgi:tetratricopeptide (TPR) repeat protein
MSVKIFISCVSKEFLAYRDHLSHQLRRLNVEIIVQEDFKDLATVTLDMLDAYVRTSDVVVHLIGDMTGAAAKPASTDAVLANYPDLAGRFPPLRELLERGEEISYTQWEAWLALYHGKPLVIAQAGAGAVSRGPEFEPTAASRSAQQAHLDRLRAVERYPGCTFVNADQLAAYVLSTPILDLLAKDRGEQSHPSPLHQLPADIADFAGRDAQMEKLLEVLSAPGGHVAISAIDGMGGVGKTALVVHVAHRLTARYPDGQIVVDMAGTSAAPLSPAQGLTRVIRVFELLMRLPEAVAELRPIYLSVLRGRRVLLILDNAHDGDQVAPLLPPEDCALIVTSRRRIAVTGMVRVDLDLLAPEEAVNLLGTIVGEGRATTAELSRIAELCGLLPLALRIAGMFLAASPHWSAERFIAALADERKRLGRLRLEGNAELDVATSLALSIGELRRARPDLADRWHELAVFPASFDTAAAGGVWGQPEEAAGDALDVLLSRSMVLYDPAQRRWRLHDLMRDFAGGQPAVAMLGAPADLAERLTAARRRHAGHYQGVLTAANDLYLKGGTQVVSGLALFDRERRNIETGQAWAAEAAADDPAAAHMCVNYLDAGADILSLRQHPRQLTSWLERVVTAAQEIGDRRGEGRALGNLGGAYVVLGETRRSIEYHEQHLMIAREIGDRRGEGIALGNLGNAYVGLGEIRRSVELHEQSLMIAREIGDRRGESEELGNLGQAYAALGEARGAIEFHEQALTIKRETGNRHGEGITLGNLGYAYAALGETRRSVEYHEQHLMIAREIGDRRGEGIALGNLGNAYAALGETCRAIVHYEQQIVIAQKIGDRGSEGYALGDLGVAYAALGEPRRAIVYYEQQIVIAREIGDRRGEGAALGNVGNAYADLGETHRAVEHYEKVISVMQEIGDRRCEGIALNNLGEVYADLGETHRAIAVLSEALVIFEAIESPHATEARAMIARLQQKDGN